LKNMITLVVLLVLITGTSFAREVQKVGTVSMGFLKISQSVRAIGMGDSYVAIADDIQSTFWNPAGLIHVKGTVAVFNQINMPADISVNSASVVRNLGRRGVFGIHFLSMSTGDMKVRTVEHPEGTGENFVAYDIVGGVSYAQRLTDRFIIGTNIRLLQTGVDDITFTGVVGDLGVLYETALRSLKLGISIQNFGPDIDYDGDYADELDKGRRGREEAQLNDYHGAPPPTIYRIGIGGNFFELTGIQAPDIWGGIVSIEMSHPNDNMERINIGLEFSYMDMMFLRGGHKIRWKDKFGYNEERWTGGFGLRMPIMGSYSVDFDYAYLGFGLLGEAADDFMASPHRLSIAVHF